MQRVKNPNEFVPLWEVTYVSARPSADGSHPIYVATVHAWNKRQAVEQATTPRHFAYSCRDNVVEVRQVSFPSRRAA